jgi:hypothetical protein
MVFGSTWLSCGQVENPAEGNRHALCETTITAGQLLAFTDRAADLFCTKGDRQAEAERRTAGAEQQKSS